jgi:hypothetical protein
MTSNILMQCEVWIPALARITEGRCGTEKLKSPVAPFKKGGFRIM